MRTRIAFKFQLDSSLFQFCRRQLPKFVLDLQMKAGLCSAEFVQETANACFLATQKVYVLTLHTEATCHYRE